MHLFALLLQQDLLDVGEHTTAGNGDTRQQLVQLLIVADGERQEAGGDTLLLVVTGCIARQLQHLGAQVLEHGGQVHRGTLADAGRIPTRLDQRRSTANGEGQSGLLGTARSSSLPLLASSLGSLLVLAALGCRHGSWRKSCRNQERSREGRLLLMRHKRADAMLPTNANQLLLF